MTTATTTPMMTAVFKGSVGGDGERHIPKYHIPSHIEQDNDKDSQDEEEDHYDNGHHHTNDGSSVCRGCRWSYRWRREVCTGHTHLYIATYM